MKFFVLSKLFSSLSHKQALRITEAVQDHVGAKAKVNLVAYGGELDDDVMFRTSLRSEFLAPHNIIAETANVADFDKRMWKQASYIRLDVSADVRKASIHFKGFQPYAVTVETENILHEPLFHKVNRSLGVLGFGAVGHSTLHNMPDYTHVGRPRFMAPMRYSNI